MDVSTKNAPGQTFVVRGGAFALCFGGGRQLLRRSMAEIWDEDGFTSDEIEATHAHKYPMWKQTCHINLDVFPVT